MFTRVSFALHNNEQKVYNSYEIKFRKDFKNGREEIRLFESQKRSFMPA